MSKRWMKLASLSMIGLVLVAVFQNCGAPSFSGYRPDGTCVGSACSSDFSSLGAGGGYTYENAPPTALKSIPSDIAHVMMNNLDCYSLMFSTMNSNPNAALESMAGNQYFGSVRKSALGTFTQNVQHFYGDMVIDGVVQYNSTGAISHSGSLCVRGSSIGALSLDQIQGTDSVLSFMSLKDSDFITGGSYFGIDVFVPVVLINASLQQLSAAKFHQNIYIFNGTIQQVQGDAQDLHLYGNARVNQWTGVNIGKVYLHGAASIGTVSTSGSGGQIVDCNVNGSNCPTVAAPSAPLPPGF